MPEDVEAMLQRDQDQWRALVALLDGAGDAAVHQPPAPPWIARDVYTHLARWISHSRTRPAPTTRSTPAGRPRTPRSRSPRPALVPTPPTSGA